ncbi:hypothetical protein ScalyP_jg1379 [Parmales sp. scaly parma]|nr:hypothetical protein ScalyP_jg1379 [Parmales sp. scaly parma]
MNSIDMEKRLAQLELWHDVAARPSTPCVDDLDLMARDEDNDDIEELQKRCIHVRRILNEKRTYPVTTYDKFLDPKKSQVPNAGLGLFVSASTTIPLGTIITYYAGHVHNHISKKSLVDQSYFLLLTGDTIVDPLLTPEVKARFINDPRNEALLNVEFVHDHDAKINWAAIVSIRPIESGEELFISYGDAYWSNVDYEPSTLSCRSLVKQQRE